MAANLTGEYQALARKYRPQTFDQVVGQEYVLNALRNSIQANRLHHAYLLTGTRGIGKTTIARIMAKSLQCERGVSYIPCGQCAACRSISQGDYPDVIEIDAASNSGVDNIRELLENTQYPPMYGRYKIYIIDEVHMLSGASFNALLKTLEAPPSYVKFILATTDVHKVIMTVISRCLQFQLRVLSVDEIAGQIMKIAKSEQVGCEGEAARLIARTAKGSMRDALSLCDQAIALGSGNITREQVVSMLSTVGDDMIERVLLLLLGDPGVTAPELLNDINRLAPNYKNLLNDLAVAFHDISMFQMIGGSRIEMFNLPVAMLEAFAPRFSPEDLQLYYQIMLEGIREYPYSPDGRSAFEMTYLRLLAFCPKKKDWIGEDNQAPLNEVAPRPGPQAAARPAVAARPAGPAQPEARPQPSSGPAARPMSPQPRQAAPAPAAEPSPQKAAPVQPAAPIQQAAAPAAQPAPQAPARDNKGSRPTRPGITDMQFYNNVLSYLEFLNKRKEELMRKDDRKADDGGSAARDIARSIEKSNSIINKSIESGNIQDTPMDLSEYELRPDRKGEELPPAIREQAASPARDSEGRRTFTPQPDTFNQGTVAMDYDPFDPDNMMPPSDAIPDAEIPVQEAQDVPPGPPEADIPDDNLEIVPEPGPHADLFDSSEGELPPPDFDEGSSYVRVAGDIPAPEPFEEIQEAEMAVPSALLDADVIRDEGGNEVRFDADSYDDEYYDEYGSYEDDGSAAGEEDDGEDEAYASDVQEEYAPPVPAKGGFDAPRVLLVDGNPANADPDEDPYQAFAPRRDSARAKLTPTDFFDRVAGYDDYYRVIIESGFRRDSKDYTALIHSEIEFDPKDERKAVIRIDDAYALLARDPSWPHNIATRLSIGMKKPLNLTVEVVGGLPDNSPLQHAQQEYLKELDRARQKLMKVKGLPDLLSEFGEDLSTLELAIFKPDGGEKG